MIYVEYIFSTRQNRDAQLFHTSPQALIYARRAIIYSSSCPSMCPSMHPSCAWPLRGRRPSLPSTHRYNAKVLTLFHNFRSYMSSEARPIYPTINENSVTVFSCTGGILDINFPIHKIFLDNHNGFLHGTCRACLGTRTSQSVRGTNICLAAAHHTRRAKRS